MTEEVKKEEVVEDEVKQETPELSPVEQRAMEMGWRPKEEWDGDDDDFVDAKEFINRQPLFDKIEHQSKELRQLRQAFDAFKTHHSKVKEAEYKRAMAALKAERRRALQEGETEHALMLEDKIEEISSEKEEFDNSQKSVEQPTVRPEFVEWSSKNKWYGTDVAMSAFADRLGIELHQKGYQPAEVLDMITKEVKREFKHKFENQRRAGAPSVESGSRQVVANEADFKMTDDERRIMNKIVAMGGITKEQYISELKKTRG